MGFGFLNLAILFGLAAVVVPPLIHLLSRRRFDVVPWAAMQFLEVSPRTRRRVFVDELLLMLLRMGLVALLVVAMAGPVNLLGRFQFFRAKGPGDVAVVLDASASMGCESADGTAFDAARRWADTLLNDLGSADKAGVVVARTRPLTLAEPTNERDAVRSAVQSLPEPRGSCDGPAAVAAAWRMLRDGGNARRDIVVLTDGQRHGWADPTSLVHWELLAAQAGAARPRVRLVNIAGDRPAVLVNWSVATVRANRAVASVGQEVTLRTGLVRHGAASPLPKLRLEIDGKSEGELSPPAAMNEASEVAFSAKHRFRTPGSHLVTIRGGPDAMSGDNRADLAIEVLPVLPVVIVEGDSPPSGTRRGSSFLRDALSPARDPTPSVRVRTVPARDFDAALLTREVPGAGPPRVLILADVPRFSPAQIDAVARFLEGGGGVLVAPGDRVDPGFYTRELHRGGRGWLPARLNEILVDDASPESAPRPDAKTFLHTALDLFREPLPGGLTDVRVPRWWPLDVGNDGRATVAARLTNGSPLFVEKPFGAGRVLLAAVPLDNSGKTNLVELPCFAPLAHELVYSLAGSRASDANLAPGQTIRVALPPETPAKEWTLETPDGTKRPVDVREGRISFADTFDSGVYRLGRPGSPPRYFVVAGDSRESDLTPLSEEDRARLRTLWPGIEFATDVAMSADATAGPPEPVELWWLALGGVIALLAGELWLTRRRARAALM